VNTRRTMWEGDNGKRKEFENRLNEINISNVPSMVEEINRSIAIFVQQGGLNQNPDINPQYQDIQTKLQQIDAIKQSYISLQKEINEYVSKEANQSTWNDTLADNGKLQKDINELEKLQKEMKVDVDSAVARDELLRTRNTNPSRHELYFFNHPIRRSMIPFFWVLSILFIGMAIIFFQLSFPTTQTPIAPIQSVSALPIMGASSIAITFMNQMMNLFSNQMMIITLIVSVIILVVVLSLRASGVF
jgi:hypothetical protein